MPFTEKMKIELSESQREELLIISRSTKAEYRMVHRAQIILLSSTDASYKEINKELSTNNFAIAKWKSRYKEAGIDGLKDMPRPGKKPEYDAYDEARVVQLACSKPTDGYSNWSQQRIGEEFGMSQSTVCRILERSKLKPHKTDYWCGKSTDP
jgi:putative transposase